jgi:SHS2 domain-containing protein
MKTNQAGFREIEHTADWALQVWAPDLGALFEQAALGMYALAETELEASPRNTRKLQLDALDSESLLVAFLNELLFFGEDENLGFDSFEVEVQDDHLNAEVSGAPFAARKKEIKAVTYHNIEIKSSQDGLEVQLVFDV